MGLPKTLFNLLTPRFKKCILLPFKEKCICQIVRFGSIISFHKKAMKSRVLLTVWCYISGEAEGNIWNWSYLGLKDCWQRLFISFHPLRRQHDVRDAYGQFATKQERTFMACPSMLRTNTATLLRAAQATNISQLFLRTCALETGVQPVTFAHISQGGNAAATILDAFPSTVIHIDLCVLWGSISVSARRKTFFKVFKTMARQ